MLVNNPPSTMTAPKKKQEKLEGRQFQSVYLTCRSAYDFLYLQRQNEPESKNRNRTELFQKEKTCEMK